MVPFASEKKPLPAPRPTSCQAGLQYKKQTNQAYLYSLEPQKITTSELEGNFLRGPIKKASSCYLKTGLGHFVLPLFTGSGPTSGRRKQRQEDTAFQTFDKRKDRPAHPSSTLCAAEEYWWTFSYQLEGQWTSYSWCLRAVRFKEPFLWESK